MKPLFALLAVALLLPIVLVAGLLGGLSAGFGRVSPDELDPSAGGYNPGSGPIYYASSRNLGPGSPNPLIAASIHDLGFGSTDANRVDKMIRSIRPRSPLIGQGAHILALGQRWRVDPLLIAQWQLESEMATTGINSPANGGNMTWAATQPYARADGCSPGPSSLGHTWAKCPSVPSGLSLWHNYVGDRYKGLANIEEYVNIYNPCSDPWNIELGFPCGTRYGLLIVDVLRAHAGPPVAVSVGGPLPEGTGYTAAIQALVPGGRIISVWGDCRDGCSGDIRAWTWVRPMTRPAAPSRRGSSRSRGRTDWAGGA